MVFRAELAHVVVHIADRQLGLHAGGSHRLKQQKRRRAGRVLGQRLVNANPNRFAGLEFALNKMFLQDFISQCLCHFSSPL